MKSPSVLIWDGFHLFSVTCAVMEKVHQIADRALTTRSFHLADRRVLVRLIGARAELPLDLRVLVLEAVHHFVGPVAQQPTDIRHPKGDPVRSPTDSKVLCQYRTFLEHAAFYRFLGVIEEVFEKSFIALMQWNSI